MTVKAEIEQSLAMFALAYIGAMSNDNEAQAHSTVKTAATQILKLIEERLPEELTHSSDEDEIEYAGIDYYNQAISDVKPLLRGDE